MVCQSRAVNDRSLCFVSHCAHHVPPLCVSRRSVLLLLMGGGARPAADWYGRRLCRSRRRRPCAREPPAPCGSRVIMRARRRGSLLRCVCCRCKLLYEQDAARRAVVALRLVRIEPLHRTVGHARECQHDGNAGGRAPSPRIPHSHSPWLRALRPLRPGPPSPHRTAPLNASMLVASACGLLAATLHPVGCNPGRENYSGEGPRSLPPPLLGGLMPPPTQQSPSTLAGQGPTHWEV